jgi:hypothetical protein
MESAGQSRLVIQLKKAGHNAKSTRKPPNANTFLRLVGTHKQNLPGYARIKAQSVPTGPAYYKGERIEHT